ncbi:hypothetical protein K402DRAFT_426449 [Aulographum hederae CBS 113979]|uniref:Uncharacterized protein n=1 Tax=Aulographum hederae CBS 113979 TaxID=1176131 RepID=A0A6G1HH97_9PEZI|nr:hypothetical protein K402DRAFT_426449 [Aulographum hederae CBS 113979]
MYRLKSERNDNNNRPNSHQKPNIPFRPNTQTPALKEAKLPFSNIHVPLPAHRDSLLSVSIPKPREPRGIHLPNPRHRLRIRSRSNHSTNRRSRRQMRGYSLKSRHRDRPLLKRIPHPLNFPLLPHRRRHLSLRLSNSTRRRSTLKSNHTRIFPNTSLASNNRRQKTARRRIIMRIAVHPPHLAAHGLALRRRVVAREVVVGEVCVFAGGAFCEGGGGCAGWGFWFDDFVGSGEEWGLVGKEMRMGGVLEVEGVGEGD